MKRVNHQIDYQVTNLFHINELAERYFYDWFKDGHKKWLFAVHFSSYQICNVYTDKGTAFNTYLKLNGPTATKQIIVDASNTRITKEEERIVIPQLVYNDSYNCHGYTFLDGKFWFELNSEWVKIILEEDNYIRCSQQELEGNGILLFYDEKDALIHSAKMFDNKGEKLVVSKFGINKLLTKSEEEIYEKYPHVLRSKTAYYNKG